MIGVELADREGVSAGESVQAVRVAAAETGLLLLSCGATGQVLRLIPPLVVTAEEIDDGLGRLGEAFGKALLT